MTASIRFAHISDVHLPLLGAPPLQQLNLKRALGWLNWQRKRRYIHTRAALDSIVADIKDQAPDHILVSGDLINIGLPAEYEAARAWLESVGAPEQVSVVPGNHDIYTRGRALRNGLPLWRAYMSNDAYGRSVDPQGPQASVFPYVRRIGDIAVIGVCSARPTPVGYASGSVNGQLDRLGELLARTRADGLFRLVMIHHPPLPGQAPPRRALDDAQALSDELARLGADLVIHGHNHTQTSVMHAGIPVLGVASASAAMAYGGEPPARYNLITISGGAIEVETRGLSKSDQRVVQVAAARFSRDSAAKVR